MLASSSLALQEDIYPAQGDCDFSAVVLKLLFYAPSSTGGILTTGVDA